MADPDASADARLQPKAEPRRSPAWLVRPAPTPELADARDRKGSQAGMAVALIGGGLFWAAVAAAVYAFRR